MRPAFPDAGPALRGGTLLAAILIATVASAAPTQETNRAPSRDFSAFKIIVDRNIFDPSRRPRVVSGPATRTVDSFYLAGTMTYWKGIFAVFDGSKPDYRQVLESGGTIAGYTVTNIGQDSVKLVSGTNELELRVGMQLRRADDGSWAAAEAPAPLAAYSTSATSGGRSSYRPTRARSAAAAAPRDARATAAPGGDAAAPDMTGLPEPDEGAPAVEPPPADPNDPVARMIQRRLRETGANPN